MIRDRDEQSPATRGCVFTAHGARDDLRQGGSSGCPGLWPGGDLALNMAFQNDVAVACPHRRTTMRCRAIHFHAPGWNADAPSMSVGSPVGAGLCRDRARQPQHATWNAPIGLGTAKLTVPSPANTPGPNRSRGGHRSLCCHSKPFPSETAGAALKRFDHPALAPLDPHTLTPRDADAGRYR